MTFQLFLFLGLFPAGRAGMPSAVERFLRNNSIQINSTQLLSWSDQPAAYCVCTSVACASDIHWFTMYFSLSCHECRFSLYSTWKGCNDSFLYSLSAPQQWSYLCLIPEWGIDRFNGKHSTTYRYHSCRSESGFHLVPGRHVPFQCDTLYFVPHTRLKCSNKYLSVEKHLVSVLF